MTNQSPNPKTQTISVIPDPPVPSTSSGIGNLYKWIPAFARMTTILLSTSYYLLATNSPVFAQVDISSLTYPGQTIKNYWTIGELLTGTNLITFVFFLAGLVFFFNLLLAAWEYLLSTGDAKKIAGATQRLLNTFTGIVVVLGSFVIVRIILSVLGIIGF